jgi:hypothetical protein
MTDSLEYALEERLLARSQVSPREVDALRVFARTLPARRPFWRGPAMQWALSAAAVVLAAVVALPILFQLPGAGGETPVPATPTPSQPAVTPTAPPSAPAPTPDTAIIRLLTASGSDVSVTVDDPDDLLVGWAPEQAEATMSVKWLDSIVEQVGPSSIRVTWVGFPRDEEVQLDVSKDSDGTLVLHFVQDAPPPFSDGEGEDRVMVLELAEPIDKDDVELTFDYPA